MSLSLVFGNDAHDRLQPDLTLTGAPELILGLVAGRLDAVEARACGLRWRGNLDALRRLQPEPAIAEQ
jgi:hypothetical protein